MMYRGNLIAVESHLGESERLALWTVRRLLRGGVACGGRERSWGDPVSLRAAAQAFQIFAMIHGAGKRDLLVGLPGSIGVTRDERRLLRAIAAAQADDAAAMDAALYKIALDRGPRACLAGAIQALAAALAAHGHWLLAAAPLTQWGAVDAAHEECRV